MYVFNIYIVIILGDLLRIESLVNTLLQIIMVATLFFYTFIICLFAFSIPLNCNK